MPRHSKKSRHAVARVALVLLVATLAARAVVATTFMSVEPIPSALDGVDAKAFFEHLGTIDAALFSGLFAGFTQIAFQGTTEQLDVVPEARGVEESIHRGAVGRGQHDAGRRLLPAQAECRTDDRPGRYRLSRERLDCVPWW